MKNIIKEFKKWDDRIKTCRFCGGRETGMCPKLDNRTSPSGSCSLPTKEIKR